MNMSVRGAKGGKGQSSQPQRTPYEAPDNLLADSVAYVLDVVSEGEIEGWLDPAYPGKCIFFDDTPLQNPDGSFNFAGVQYWLRTGTPNQEPVPGFSAVENEVGVGVGVEFSQPVVRSISAADVDAAMVKVGVNQLSTLNTENGDLTGATVDFSIDMQVGSGGWATVADLQISGKTTSGYQKSYRIELPAVRPVSLRVRRRTPDSPQSEVSDDLFFVSYTEIIDAKLRYPDTAYVALAIPAQAFGGRVPRRSYRLKGMRCWVPSNYDPTTRIYDESTIWDGTFKQAYTNNPAFFTYTVFIEDRWGLGARIAPDLVDKWRIYQIGKYCDDLVANGLGGLEPRFTMNGVMNTRESAYQVITQLSATFRGVTYWGAGAVVPVQDAPADPVKLVTNANVVDGVFSYSGTSLQARKTAAVVSLRDASDHYRLKAAIVYEDQTMIQKYGRRQADLSMPFTTSRGEAMRAANWLVDTDTTQRETVNYQAGFDHAPLRPGDRVLISDKARVGFRMGGRILGIAPDRLTVDLDAAAELLAGQTHKLMAANDLGEYIEIDLVAGQVGSLASVNLVVPLPADVSSGAIFVLTASNLAPRLFRILSNVPEYHLHSIIALEDDPNKFARIEQGINVSDDAPYILPNVARPKAVTGLSATVYYRESPAGLVAAVSWQVAPGQNVAAFQIDVSDHDGLRSFAAVQAGQSFDIPLNGTNLGPYAVHVRARNALNTWGEFSTLTFTVDPEILAPRVVTGFGIRIVGDHAFLSWDNGGAVVSHYDVRFAAESGVTWEGALSVETDIAGREVVVPALAGTYLIKAVSVFGFESVQASIVMSNTISLSHFNVVEDYAAEPEFLGDLSNGLVRANSSLVLLSGKSTYSETSTFEGRSIYSGANIPASATFELAEPVDLGASYTSRLSASMRAFAFLTSSSTFSETSAFSGTSIWGELSQLWRVEFEVATTDDDPADIAAVWSNWGALIVGDYFARGFKFRVLFSSDDPDIAIVLQKLAFQVDMPDRIVKGSDIYCPVGGVAVDFDPPFMAKPTIVIDGQELPQGARAVRSAASRSGFTQEFFDDAGNSISATFDFTAAGYGRAAD